MPNETYAKEWLRFAERNLETAILLYEANHYSDIIGVELQQTLEKSFKAIFAYRNMKIPRDHDLVKLYYLIEEFIAIDTDDVLLLRMATNYYKDERYPNPNYTLPPKDEILEVLKFTQNTFHEICRLLKV